jgi:glycosyltransferase involved in cell wall biosynthesis
MIDLPKISIITPCFNHEFYIERTIRSVLEQGYPNLEYIVVNDGSTDGSGDVIRKFGDQISQLIELGGHRPSPVVGLNQAFAVATGDVMGWISSDDILLPNSLFVLAQVFMDIPRANWVTGHGTTINVRDEIVNSRPRRKNKLDYINGDWAVIQQESTFFRRSTWLTAGGQLDEDYLQAFDTELWTRFFDRNELVHVDAPLGAFRRGPQSRSSRNINEFLDYNTKALEVMRQRSGRKQLVLARIWKGLSIRPLLAVLQSLPHSWLLKLFPAFSEPVATYSFERDSWFSARSSSFRRG